MAQTFENLEKYQGCSQEMLEQAVHQATDIVKGNLKDFTDFFQSPNTEKGFYWQTENVEWTTGFWTGVVWLAYELTKDEAFKKTGEIHVDSFLNRIQKKIDVNYHDMGFLYSLSCVAAYKLCGSEKGKEAAILAADHLLTRYRENGEFIQAWGNVGDPKDYRLIIDCLLNLPLLYWATEVTGNPEYAEKACKHIHTAMQCVLREDHSTYHTYYINPETGKPSYGVTHQGNRNGSAWARGQAWGVYGVALSYRYQQNPEYIQMFRDVTDYFIEHLPEDLIPYWDFDFDTGSTEPRDSSSCVIVSCGIYEMLPYLEKEEAEKYRMAADKMLCALIEKCAVKSIEQSNGLLLHGTYARSSEENTCKDRGVDECNTWGDYFYLEALRRRCGTWNPYW